MRHPKILASALMLLLLIPFAFAQPSCTGVTTSRIRSAANGNFDVCPTWNVSDIGTCSAYTGAIMVNRYHEILSGHTVTTPAVPTVAAGMKTRGISVLSGGILTLNGALTPPTSSSASIYVSGTLNVALGSGVTMNLSTTTGGGELYICNGGVVNFTSGILKMGKVTIASGGTINLNGGELSLANTSGTNITVQEGAIININSSSSKITSAGTYRYTKLDGTIDCKSSITSDAIAGNFQLGEVSVSSNTSTGLIRTQTAFIPRNYSLNSGTSTFTAANNFFGFNSNYGGTVEYYGSSAISLDNLSTSSVKNYYNLIVNTSGGLSLTNITGCVDVVGALQLMGGNLKLAGRKCIIRGAITYTGSNYIESTSTSTLWVVGKLSYSTSNCTNNSSGITTNIPATNGTSIYTISKTAASQTGTTTTVDIKNPVLRFSSSSGGTASVGTLKIFRDDVVYANYSKLTVSALLQLVKGILRTSDTDPDYLYVSLADSSAIQHSTTGSASYTGFVSGYLKRRIAAGNTFDFPVGYVNLSNYSTPSSLPPSVSSTSDKHRRISFTINSMSVANQDLSVRFVNTLTGTDTCQGTLVATQNGNILRSIHPEGYWISIPSQPAVTVNYDARLYIHSFYGIADNLFFAVKRPETSTSCTDWSTFNLPVPSDNLRGRIIEPDAGVPLLYKGYAERNGYTGFSHHAIALMDPVIPLPVELISFTGELQQDKVRLSWTTSSEINNSYFTIEKSENAEDFIELSRVPGAGNSNQILDYAITDPAPFEPVTYYRLKQTDFDGTYTNHPIIAVQQLTAGNTTLQILGNPVAESLNLILHVNSGESTLHLMDLSGRIINRFPLLKGQGSLSVPVSHLPAGIYILRLIDGSEMKVLRIIIN